MSRLRLVMHFLTGFSRKEVVALLIVLAVSASYIPIPILLRRVLDHLQAAETDMREMLAPSLVLFGIFLFQSISSVFTKKILTNYIRTIIQKCRQNLLSLYLNASVIPKDESITSIHKKIYTDTELADRFFNSLLSNILPSSIIAIATFGIMVYINLAMTLWVLGLSAVTMIIVQYFRKHRDRITAQYYRSYEHLSKIVLFVLRFKKLITIHSMTKAEQNRIEENLYQLKSLGVRMEMGFTKATTAQEYIQSNLLLVVLFISALLKNEGRIELNTVLVFFFMIYILRKQFLTISNHLQNITEGLLALKNLNTLEVKLTNAIPNKSNKNLHRIEFKGHLQFENVCFEYPEQPKLLEGINFSLLPNKINLIQGANGTGKSTLMQLTIGYLRPESGKIIIEGVDSNYLDFNDFRNQVSVVFQENELFDGTLHDNLFYGVSETPKNKVEAALVETGLDKWVDALPQKLSTKISELTDNISGGQKQRLILTRALLRKPKLLILDEPTNHLDVSFIASMTNVLEKLKNQMTILLISHDASLGEVADQTLILHDKKIKTK